MIKSTPGNETCANHLFLLAAVCAWLFVSELVRTEQLYSKGQDKRPISTVYTYITANYVIV